MNSGILPFEARDLPAMSEPFSAMREEIAREVELLTSMHLTEGTVKGYVSTISPS